jgi:hypothetical protein
MTTCPRCIRFAPPELSAGGPALEQWRKKYVPIKWRSTHDHTLYCCPHAADLNDRYGEMLDALARSKCPSEVLHGLARELIRHGEEARPWIAAGATDDADERRWSSDSQFLEQVGKIRSLALQLAGCVGQEQSALALTKALRVTKGL